MEKIKHHIMHLNSVLYNIRLLFANQYEVKHHDCYKEFYNLDIPTLHDDKVNRKSDIKAIGSDMKKVLKEKEQELVEK